MGGRKKKEEGEEWNIKEERIKEALNLVVPGSGLAQLELPSSPPNVTFKRNISVKKGAHP